MNIKLKVWYPYSTGLHEKLTVTQPAEKTCLLCNLTLCYCVLLKCQWSVSSATWIKPTASSNLILYPLICFSPTSGYLKLCTHFLFSPMLSFPFIWSPEYMTTSTNYKAPLSTTFSILLSLPLSWWKHSPQHLIPELPQSTFLHTKQQVKPVLHISMFVFDNKRRQNKLNWMVASIPYI